MTFSRRFLSHLLVIVTGVVMVLIAVVVIHRTPAIVEIAPARTGQPERCLTCHTGIESMGASHSTQVFGCVSCHGGQALALNAKDAHQGMVRNPGDLSVADKYCGTCHPAQASTVARSIMTTYTGAIALVRRTFGLQSDGTAQYATSHIDHLDAFTTTASDSALIQKFAVNCLTCHARSDSIKEAYFYRSTGCSSCHVLYNDAGLYQGGDPTTPRDQPGYPALHQITKQIPYTQCNHCHNRGNYDLRTMTFLRRTDLPLTGHPSAEETRLKTYYQPIGQFTRCEYELDCIDCHTKQEVMGDGVLHNNRAEAQYIQCQTCHGTSSSPPLDSYKSSLLDPSNLATQAPRTLLTARGEPLTRTQWIDGKWVLTAKVTGKTYTIPLVQGSGCTQKVDQQASRYCHECHSVAR